MRKEDRDRYEKEWLDSDEEGGLYPSPYPGQQGAQRYGAPYIKDRKVDNKELQFARDTVKTLMERQEELVNKNAQLRLELDRSKLENRRLLEQNNRLAYQIPPNALELSEAPWIVDLPPPLEVVKHNRKSLERGTCDFCQRHFQFIVASEQFPGHDGLVKSCEFCLANFEAYRDVVQ